MKRGEKMCKYFNLYDADKAEKNLQNIHKYGTANPVFLRVSKSMLRKYAKKNRKKLLMRK